MQKLFMLVMFVAMLGFVGCNAEDTGVDAPDDVVDEVEVVDEVVVDPSSEVVVDEVVVEDHSDRDPIVQE